VLTALPVRRISPHAGRGLREAESERLDAAKVRSKEMPPLLARRLERLLAGRRERPLEAVAQDTAWTIRAWASWSSQVNRWQSGAAKEEWAHTYFLEGMQFVLLHGAPAAGCIAELNAALEAGLVDAAALRRTMDGLNAEFEGLLDGPTDPTPEERAKVRAIAIRLLRENKLLRLDYTPPVTTRPKGRSTSRGRRVRRRASRAAARDGPDDPADDQDDVIRARCGWSR
jgi:hypothetical protein